HAPAANARAPADVHRTEHNFLPCFVRVRDLLIFREANLIFPIKDVCVTIRKERSRFAVSLRFDEAEHFDRFRPRREVSAKSLNDRAIDGAASQLLVRKHRTAERSDGLPEE